MPRIIPAVPGKSSFEQLRAGADVTIRHQSAWGLTATAGDNGVNRPIALPNLGSRGPAVRATRFGMGGQTYNPVKDRERVKGEDDIAAA